jgi:hypothetical protein
MCPKSFPYKDTLETHIKTEHKEDKETLLALVEAESARRNELTRKKEKVGLKKEYERYLIR